MVCNSSMFVPMVAHVTVLHFHLQYEIPVWCRDRADAVLREFGDAEQYLRVIEGDMRDVARMLQQLSAAAAERRRAKNGAPKP